MPADAILTLAWLVLAHLVADFIVQTGAVVGQELERPARLAGPFAHALGVGRPGAGRAGVRVARAVVAAATTVAHVIIDRTKILMTRRAERRALAEAHRRHEGRRRPPVWAGRGRRCRARTSPLTRRPTSPYARPRGRSGCPSRRRPPLGRRGRQPVRWPRPRRVPRLDALARRRRCLLIANVRAGALFVATLVRPTEFGVETGALAGTAGLSRRAGRPVRPPAPQQRPGRSWDIRIGPLPAGSRGAAASTPRVAAAALAAAPRPRPAVPPPPRSAPRSAFSSGC